MKQIGLFDESNRLKKLSALGGQEPEKHYGYKDHVKVDAQSKLITDHEVTDAAAHNSQALPGLLVEKDKVLYADSAYSGGLIAEQLPKGIEKQIHEKGHRSRPMSEDQKTRNKRKSRIRARIEYVFGCMAGILRGITVRSIGMEQAKFNIGLTNLVYNLIGVEILS